MDVRLFATVFSTILIAEFGDKTQLATLLYASDASHPRLTVFLAAVSALVLASALGVFAGSLISEFASHRLVRWVAGLGFMGVGVWVLAAGD